MNNIKNLRFSVKALFVYAMIATLFGCPSKKQAAFSGKTMGTTWQVKIVAGFFTDTSDLKKKIETRLKEINKSMSTYDKTSEISRFNDMVTPYEKFYVSDDFLRVLVVAEELFRVTGRAWDGTIKPLVDIWGFSGPEDGRQVPEREEIKVVLKDIGFDRVEISEQGYIVKTNPSITLDLASIAKGYAVDSVAELLERNGINNFLVEIGGEVYVSGFKADGGKWRIGINTPLKDAPRDDVFKAVSLANRAVATSGDYRKFFEIGGKMYSHVLDPVTGHPVSNGVVSVSVVAGTCTFADGLATALMVMGREEAIRLVDGLENTECLIIEMKDGVMREHVSKGFKTDM